MSEFNRMKVRLRKTPFLVVQPKKVQLADSATAFREINGLQAPFVMDLGGGIEQIGKVIGTEDRNFTLKEIIKILGVNYRVAYTMMQRRMIVPSVRGQSGSGTGSAEVLFSWTDAFAAGVIGSMRRVGLPAHLSRAVRRLICDGYRSQKVEEQAVSVE